MPTSEESGQHPFTMIMTLKSEEDQKKLNDVFQQMAAMPPDQNPILKSAIAIGTIHYLRVLFMENNTKFAIITDYDGTLESYILDTIDTLGQVFNLILPFMKDAPALPVEEHADELLAYVRATDLAAGNLIPFWGAYPGTVKEIQRALDWQKKTMDFQRELARPATT